jgi:hypothetical protein
LSLFHFPPASYMTQNLRLADYSVCRWYVGRIIWPWKWWQYVPPKHLLNFN